MHTLIPSVPKDVNSQIKREQFIVQKALWQARPHVSRPIGFLLDGQCAHMNPTEARGIDIMARIDTKSDSGAFKHSPENELLLKTAEFI